MRKYVLFMLILIIPLSIVGCAGENNSNLYSTKRKSSASASIETDEVENTDVSKEQKGSIVIKTPQDKDLEINLGTSFDSVVELLETNGIKYEIDDDIIRTYHNESSDLILQFADHDDRTLIIIYVVTEEIVSSAGLKKGDAKADIDEKQGKNYKSYEVDYVGP